MTKYGNDRNFLHVLSNTRTPVLAREIVLKENTAVPTYNELLVHYGVDSSTMRETFDDKCLRQFSLALDMWETLAKFLEMPNSDIVNIKSQGDVVVQTLKMFECWKQRRGSMATYEAMVKALLQIGRTDLAEKVITLRQSSRPPKNTQTLSCFQESILTAPTSPASSSSSGIEDAASSAMSPLSLSATTREHTAQEVIQTLSELEDEFYELVTFVETALKRSNVQIDTLTRRFSMLPQSIRRRHQTDENYKAIRQRVLNSESVKKLFDNLTELKHWSYMMPDTLAHILRGVKIEEVHKRISEYKEKLLAFKANTKLKELIGISFPVPDYCMELTMEVERWEDKTIQEVEDRAVNIMRRSDHSGQNTPLGWKAVNVGSVKITFILKKVVKVNKENILDACRDSGIKHVQIDGERLYSETNTEFKVKVYYHKSIGYTLACR